MVDLYAALLKAEDFKPPAISSLAVSNPQPVVGTRFTIDVATDASYPLALRGVRPTLQLVDGNGKQLTLAARQPADADLTVIAGDPDTLLSAQRSTHIAIGPAA
jgi:hypothetical protein